MHLSKILGRGPNSPPSGGGASSSTPSAASISPSAVVQPHQFVVNDPMQTDPSTMHPALIAPTSPFHGTAASLIQPLLGAQQLQLIQQLALPHQLTTPFQPLLAEDPTSAVFSSVAPIPLAIPSTMQHHANNTLPSTPATPTAPTPSKRKHSSGKRSSSASAASSLLSGNPTSSTTSPTSAPSSGSTKKRSSSSAKKSSLSATLRQLESEAYSAVISAFRAQGELTWRKDRILQELRILLRIPEERQRLELIRIANDETLNEIARYKMAQLALPNQPNDGSDSESESSTSETEGDRTASIKRRRVADSPRGSTSSVTEPKGEETQPQPTLIAHPLPITESGPAYIKASLKKLPVRVSKAVVGAPTSKAPGPAKGKGKKAPDAKDVGSPPPGGNEGEQAKPRRPKKPAPKAPSSAEAPKPSPQDSPSGSTTGSTSTSKRKKPASSTSNGNGKAKDSPSSKHSPSAATPTGETKVNGDTSGRVSSQAEDDDGDEQVEIEADDVEPVASVATPSSAVGDEKKGGESDVDRG